MSKLFYGNDPFLHNNSIYSVLVRKKDFHRTNPLLATPTINLSKKQKVMLVKIIVKVYGNIHNGFRVFVKSIENYLRKIYTNPKNAKYRFMQNFYKNKINIVFLRVIALALTKSNRESQAFFEKIIWQDSKVTIERVVFSKTSTNQIAYLGGVITGDGHLSKTENEIVIADGSVDGIYLKESELFMQFLQTQFKSCFNIESSIKQIKNHYVLRINSKWLCRFFNKKMEIPLGKKCQKIKRPECIKRSEKYFWRGMMDSDGFVRKNQKAITFVTKSKVIAHSLIKFYNRHKIIAQYAQERSGIRITLATESMLKYAKLVGFSHPKKSTRLAKHLQEGPKYKVVYSVTAQAKKKLGRLVHYLRPYNKNSVYIKLDVYKRKAEKDKIQKILDLVKKRIHITPIRVRRKRYNDHYYIHSKSLNKFLRKEVKLKLPWEALNKKEVSRLQKEWINYGKPTSNRKRKVSNSVWSAKDIRTERNTSVLYL